jgi:hypothetical protein
MLDLKKNWGSNVLKIKLVFNSIYNNLADSDIFKSYIRLSREKVVKGGCLYSLHKGRYNV